MSTALVAKSYQSLQQVGEVYKSNGRDYIKVRMKNGQLKAVRVYTEVEYNKHYPEISAVKQIKSTRDILGFCEQGFIWLFKGNTYDYIDWFKLNHIHYTRDWGWNVHSDETLPSPLPEGIEAVKLYWDEVSLNGELINEKDLVTIADSKRYDEGKSKFVGEIGDKVDVVVTCTKAITLETGFYGTPTMHIFYDEDENVYTWTTTSKVLAAGTLYHLKGTIKDLTTFRNCKQNVLTRCRVEEIEDD